MISKPPTQKNIFFELEELKSQIEAAQFSLNKLKNKKKELKLCLFSYKKNIKYLKKVAKVVNIKHYKEVFDNLQVQLDTLSKINTTINSKIRILDFMQKKLETLEQKLKKQKNNVLEFKKNAKKSKN